ncbi:histone H1.8 [Pyxicephalus adspersus]|uniref:H15 domain-containing protein n=1 Tax=Pyxicephalus adspersus TaxID=30357 RepID=A0AAV2ZKL6_PYXAD|nr:TPA: hypothetical protein GDO54_016718 [Pyxicephalus adspersus]
MAPKKAVAASKEAAPEVAVETKTVAPKTTKLKTLVNPSTLAMVVEVLKKNSERKGTSVQAIRASILSAHPTVDPVRLKSLLRNALNKGIETGVLIRPPKSSATGATGRFKLAKPLPKTKEGSSSNTSENVDPDAQPKEEKPKKKAAKKAKSTESEGEKPEMKADTSSNKEKSSEEKPKATKRKKDAEEESESPTEPKKTKVKKADDGSKTKKKPDKEKAETSEKSTKKVLKDSDENPTAKTSKKGKK